MIPSKEEGQAIVDRVLSMSRADDVFVTLAATQTTHLRFARNAVSANGEQSDLVLTIESSFGRRSASTAVNQLDARTLAEAVSRSEQMARLAPEDPEHMPGLGPQTYVEAPAYDEHALEAGAAEITRGTAGCIARAEALGLTGAGYSHVNATAEWVGNRRGLRGHQRATNAAFSHTVRSSSGGGSGWAASVAGSASRLDFEGCSRVAMTKARASVEPRPLEDRPPCQMVKDNIWVDAEGTVILCIGSKQTLIGNVNETSMAQIVHSQVRLDVLRQHWEGDYDKGLCSNCEQWYSAYGTTTDESEYNAFMSPDTQYYRGKGPIEIGW